MEERRTRAYEKHQELSYQKSRHAHELKFRSLDYFKLQKAVNEIDAEKERLRNAFKVLVNLDLCGDQWPQ